MAEILATKIKLLLCRERTVISSSIKLSTFFLLLVMQSFGQDTTCQINTTWTGLKTQLQRRSEIAVNLATMLSKTKADKEQLDSLRTSAIDLFKYIDTLGVRDSLVVSLAETKNNKLTKTLAGTLIKTENDKKNSANHEFVDLLIRLEGCENRIALAKQDYNEACKICNRTDLLFREEQINKAEEIKF
jgi:hypothetical protein